MAKPEDLYPRDPKRFQNGTLNTLHYKHPKYCYYKCDPNTVYKVIGYHHTLNQYKIQSTIERSKFILVDPYDTMGIWDKELIEELKKRFG